MRTSPRYLAGSRSCCSRRAGHPGPGGCSEHCLRQASTEVVSAAGCTRCVRSSLPIPAYASTCSALTRHGVNDRASRRTASRESCRIRQRPPGVLTEPRWTARSAPYYSSSEAHFSYSVQPPDAGVAAARTSLSRGAAGVCAGYTFDCKVRFSEGFVDARSFCGDLDVRGGPPFVCAGVSNSRIPSSKVCLTLRAPYGAASGPAVLQS